MISGILSERDEVKAYLTCACCSRRFVIIVSSWSSWETVTLSGRGVSLDGVSRVYGEKVLRREADGGNGRVTARWRDIWKKVSTVLGDMEMERKMNKGRILVLEVVEVALEDHTGTKF